VASALWYGAARTPKTTSRVPANRPFGHLSDRADSRPTKGATPWVIPALRLRYARRATDHSFGAFPLHQPGIEVLQ
jgi:hypothetical protein